jgi:hypothetical protein
MPRAGYCVRGRIALRQLLTYVDCRYRYDARSNVVACLACVRSSRPACVHVLRGERMDEETAASLKQPVQVATLVRVEPGSSTISGRCAVLAGIRPGRDAAAVAYQEGELYDSVVLGAGSLPVERNSVLLIPQLLTSEECSALIEDAEQMHAAAHSRQASEKKRRLWVQELSPSSGELVDKVLRERLLPFISKHLPTVEDYVWARSESAPVDACSNLAPLRTQKREPKTSLSSLQYRFSPRVRLALAPRHCSLVSSYNHGTMAAGTSSQSVHGWWLL